MTSKLGNMYASPVVLSTDQIEGLLQTTEKARDETKKKIGGKGERPYAIRIRQQIEEKTGVLFSQIKTNRAGKAEKSADVGREMFCVMLDHAARKLISRLSWIKNAEARRNEFETNLARLDDVSEAARTFLDQYCEERTKTSNAEDEYRIRRAAVAGWKEVLAAWKKCKTVEQRIDAVRDMQGDSEKFGDVNLFTDLAADGAEAVWNDFDPDILADYVAGKQAEYDKQRFKVPAYRHPDPLSHPIFCDFGKSRPGVKFSVHECSKKSISSKQGKIELRRLNIDLISHEDSSIVSGYPLRWQSKRLARDIGLGLIANGELADSKTTIAKDVPRLDRFGKSERTTTETRTIGIYSDEFWNSRLQISRSELDQIANDLKKNGGNPFDKSTWSDRAQKMLDRVKWFVSFSPNLRYPDTWVRYHNTDNIELPQCIVKKGQNWVWKWRFGNGLLRYIPGLRILSVDLGHRFGASCAVWEVVSKKQIEAAAKKSGQSVPGKSDVFFTVEERTDKDGKSFTRKTVYRRIALDSVKDACWARLDRQFTIKLQGEERDPRPSTPGEIKDANKFLKQIGLELPEKRAKKLNRIDRLLEELVRAMRLRLKRHGNLKRAKRELAAETVILPGNKTEVLKTDEAKKERILSSLRILFELRQTRHWTCSKEIEAFWTENIVPLLTAEAAKLDKDASRNKKKTDDEMEEPSKQRRQADGQKWEKAFAPVAKAMLKKNRKAWCKELERIWAEEDDLLKAKMKELRRLILPRPGKEKKANGKITKEFRESISRRGGLSVNRINTIRELYQVSKAFFMRPGGKNDKIEKGDDSIRNFGKRILDIHERLRQNRVKQLASRIIEAALGLGGGFEGKEQDERREESCCTMRQFLDRKRDKKAPEGDPRFRPVHAVVIENLDNYRPDQMQARREARMLMQWASGKVRDILKDHCQLYGLFLMQVGAAYTSQQDSRTGMPGMRCVAVPVSEFAETGLIGKRVKKIRDKKESERTPTDRLLVDLAARCENISANDSKKTLLIPKRGGDLFVTADGKGHGIQADLNAAANIGLKALTDYDCPIFFWKIACTPQGKPAVRNGEKYELLVEAKTHQFLPTDISETKAAKEKKGKKKEERNYNVWRDISCDPLTRGLWRYTKIYWADVEKRVCEKLGQLNNVIFDKIESPF